MSENCSIIAAEGGTISGSNRLPIFQTGRGRRCEKSGRLHGDIAAPIGLCQSQDRERTKNARVTGGVKVCVGQVIFTS